MSLSLNLVPGTGKPPVHWSERGVAKAQIDRLEQIDQLREALVEDDFVTFNTLLTRNPDLDVNLVPRNDYMNVLHMACFYGHTKFVERTLRHKRADPNFATQGGDTPLLLSVVSPESLSCLAALLRDKRVSLLKTRGTGSIDALRSAIGLGNVQAVMIILALRGQEVVTKRGGITEADLLALHKCVSTDKTKMGWLVDAFRRDPNLTIESCRVSVRIYERATVLLAMSRLVRHRLVQTRPMYCPPDTARFFAMMRRIGSQEVQVRVCNMVYGLSPGARIDAAKAHASATCLLSSFMEERVFSFGDW
jgi:hypothetical protein